MDGASGAFAVVSLAIQLFEIVQKTNNFIKDLRNVPGELTRLCENLDQLGSLLGNVKQLLEQQFLISRLPGTPIFIMSALQQCSRALEPLKKIVDEAKDASNGHRSIRTGKSLRHVMKKEHIQELLSQLRDAKFDLQSAVLNNSWQLQYVINSMMLLTVLIIDSIQHSDLMSRFIALNTVDVEKQPPTNMLTKATVSQLDKDVDCCIVRPRQPLSITIEQTGQTWYNDVLGSIRIHRKSKRSNHTQDLRQNPISITIEEHTFLISPSFLRRAFELRFCNSFGRIEKSLNVYPVLMFDDPIFEMCEKGDMVGMQVAFGAGKASPFVVDTYGDTLLRVSSLFHSNERRD